MCGFVGFSGALENRQQIINHMMARILHRGPDMGDSYLDDEMALGFRRLSIIDLSANAGQPMQNEDGSVVLVFNGEIYNFQALREELIVCGHTFRTQGDAEVLLHGYEEFGGDELVHRLRGMFAFVIWDRTRGQLFGARDHFGIKPFYYASLPGGQLIFGSEIKSFLEHPDFTPAVNRDALRPYLTFQYSSGTDTFFSGVYKLPPAHSFTWTPGGEMKISRYWDIDFADAEGSFDEFVERVDDCVRESVSAHRISDVKVGSFLSGGVDSSYITAALMPDKTFSVGFAVDRFNETDEAAELSRRLGIQNFKKMLTAEECFAAFPTIQYHMDEPQSNPSSVPLYFLAQLAREHVTVVLSGEGADEIFAGYEWYDETPMMRKYKKFPAFIRRAAGTVAKHLPYFRGHDFLIKCTGRPEDWFIGQARVFPEKEALALLREDCRGGKTPSAIAAPIYDKVKGKDELTKKQYLDLCLWMPGDILLKADKMSMAHSLELRVPFLDREVMALAQTIPARYRITEKGTKYVLRQAANRTLPDEWATRPKKGFPVPIRFWLREERWYKLVREIFSADYAAEFFDRDALLRLLDDHYQGSVNNGRKIWTVYTFLV
ncbi:MAG: asparagine synthase (glutamine-hydrolyzing) [Clostridia bacterium]|nr:asparagine synthase (glutamine-hydrolyzing) [Clostridia bacterium]